MAGMPVPLHEELIHALHNSRARFFCHDIVMDAIEISMALDRDVLLDGSPSSSYWRPMMPRALAAFARRLDSGRHASDCDDQQRCGCASILVHQEVAPPLANELLVFSVSPVIREMVNHSRRWTSETPAMTRRWNASSTPSRHPPRFVQAVDELPLGGVQDRLRGCAGSWIPRCCTSRRMRR